MGADRIYDLGFSQRVVLDFISRHARGWCYFKQAYPRFQELHAIHVFRTSRRRWYILKKLVKLGDRLSYSDWISGIDGLIEKNIVAQTAYFSRLADQYYTEK